MLVLGIESTAHTFGAAVLKDGKVLSNVRRMYVPEEGGIHPREAADHHVVNGPEAVSEALSEARIDRSDLDLVAFSRGPGLGPCLRIGATIARAIALGCGIPIVGVNHCVAHLEIGQTLGCIDPVLLYASGGNTQVIAYVRGRYRVLGETLDIGIGNMLDKLGREMGMAFPAGPGIERLASSSGDMTEDDRLPYSVKGMDVSFSGLLTAATAKIRKGADPSAICRSIQETSFAMLCEVAERAMAHVGATELLFGGGVACNGRLQAMARTMARDRGADFYCPEKGLLVDNGAMIGYLGMVMDRAGIVQSMEDTQIDQRFRTDQVEVTWRKEKRCGEIHTPGTVTIPIGKDTEPGIVIGRGAEAIVTTGRFGDLHSAIKSREPKGYRHPAMEERLTRTRTRSEVRMISAIREAGIRTPYVFDVDVERGTMTMELLRGPRLASVLNVLPRDEQESIVIEMGRIAGRLHASDIVHGDLTTSNFILLSRGEGPSLALIDCSLSERTAQVEKKGVDMRLFFEVFGSTHQDLQGLEGLFLDSYRRTYNGHEEVLRKMDEINSRGRYLGG